MRDPSLIATDLVAVADAKREAQQQTTDAGIRRVRRAEEKLLREAAEALLALHDSGGVRPTLAVEAAPPR